MKPRRSLLGATSLLAVSGLLLTGCQTARTTSTAAPTTRSPAAAKALAGVDIQRALDAVYPALVRIHVVMEQGEDGRMRKQRASGSGTIISKDGYIVTNHHVAGRATRIVCRLANREEVDAVMVGTDALTDICVLKIDPASRRNPQEPLPVAQFGDSDKLRVGDVVLAMGSPAGVSQSVTKGIVANTAMISPSGSMMLDGESVGEIVRWIGHDAVIYGGNSGGPLVNLAGEIIGVNEVGIGSLGGAIPSNLAEVVAKELIAQGYVSRSWVGLDVQPLLKSQANDRGVLVCEVLPDSPAKAAGLQPGDFITQVNGVTVPESRAPEDIPLFNRLVLSAPVGRTLNLKGVRDGKPASWTMTTAPREPKEARETELKGWGLTVRDFTRESALEELRKDKRGVLVDSVRTGGPCAESKPPLRRGDVITKVGTRSLANVADLAAFTREFTQGASGPKPLLVTFERNAQEMATVARVGPEVQDDKPSRPAKAWLGVQTQVLTRELAEALALEGRKGVRVTQVFPGSAAEKAGLKRGDVLLKLDGQVINASTPSDQELFENLIRAYKVGAEAELEGVRDGQPLKVTATLDKQPKSAAELPEYKDELFEFTAREISAAERADERLEDTVQGLRISALQPAGWAALAGLSAGDILLSVDGKPVSTVAELKQMLLGFRETKPRRIVLFGRRGIRTGFFELEPKW